MGDRLKKVMAWRLVSFTTAGIVAQAFLGQALVVESWTLTAILNVQMTAIHYVFEWAWERRR